MCKLTVYAGDVYGGQKYSLGAGTIHRYEYSVITICLLLSIARRSQYYCACHGTHKLQPHRLFSLLMFDVVRHLRSCTACCELIP